MSENQLADLYVEDGTGGYIGIDPRTIAIAVKDESKDDKNVQDFINEIDSNAVRYLSEWNATGQNNFNSIITPVRKGYTYKVVGTETTINNKTYKPGDFLIINKDVNSGYVTENDIDVLLGYGNEGSKINRYVADVVENYAKLLQYPNPVINTVIIVANDENHNDLLSYYNYSENGEPSYEYIVETYADLWNLLNIETPNFENEINENIISLISYIGASNNVLPPEIVYSSPYSIVKVNHDETHYNETTYYKWENNDWVYQSASGSGWIYMFSRHELTDGIFKVKGSVRTYSDLPRENQEVGDVYNVLDTGANYVWTQDGWDKLSETVDLSNYYTKEEVNSLIDNIDLSNYYTKSETYNKEEVDEMIQSGGSLPPQSGNAGKFLSTNGTTASWEDLPSPVVLRDWR